VPPPPRPLGPTLDASTFPQRGTAHRENDATDADAQDADAAAADIVSEKMAARHTE
tara:strand:+ start:136 stop:303 length:168 start_codon:yes stop_codon:yes gene_type:complete